MEITINKFFCLNLYVNPLRDTWYSRKYAEPQKDGGQQPRFDHGRYTTWPTGYMHHDACIMMHASRTGWGYTVLSVYCQCLVILQPIRAREIYLLKKSWISANQKGWLICLFPTLTNLVLSVLQDNKPIESLKNRCISRKTETGNQKPYISKYN